jgi:hypothetical protein
MVANSIGESRAQVNSINKKNEEIETNEEKESKSTK